MLNTVVLAAGDGTRFEKAGYDKPKPLIDIFGKTMIKRVVNSLVIPNTRQEFYVVMKKSHKAEWDDVFEADLPGRGTIIPLDKPTSGAVETLLNADFLLDGNPILLSNCDQLINFQIDDEDTFPSFCDGTIFTFNSTNPHHSYVKYDKNGIITDIKEKRVISDSAVLGIYAFHDSAYLRESCQTILDNYCDGECYISHVIDLMVNDGAILMNKEIDVYSRSMLGTPYELEIFKDKVKAGRWRL